MELPPFNEYLGIRAVRVADGEAEGILKLEPHHLNKRGVVHGGVLSAALDSALGAAVVASIPKEWWCATISLSVQYLEGARGGTLTARGRVLRRGSRVAFASGEVLDETGTLVATAEGSWHLWPHKPGEKPVAGGAVPGGHVWVHGTGERLRVGKIVAVGRNYAAHVAEMGNAEASPPVVFFKPSTAIVQDGGVVRIPSGLGSVHHEVEMVVAIGRSGCRIPAESAMEHVLGYAVGLDLTLRDLQSAAKKAGEPWALAKGFDGSAPVSPVVPRERVGDGSGLEIALEVNGEVRQKGSTSHMIHDVAHLVALASRLVTLERGDLLFTGTPEGVGPIVPGDVLEASLAKVGTLRVTVEGV